MVRIDAFYERNDKHPKWYPGLANPGSVKRKKWSKHKQAWENDNPPQDGHSPTTQRVRNNDSMASRFASGCGRDISSGPFGNSDVNNPNYDQEMYVGETSPSRCDADAGIGCGRYANYQGPKADGQSRAFFANTVDMTSSTTGVGGGAVVRAIFKVGQAWKRQDRFGYADPNVPCSQAKRVTRWRYGIVVGANKVARGWIPHRLNKDNHPHCRHAP
jgi:hypothetical protein